MLGGSVAVPFLLDVEVHIRLLVALPLLIIAEAAVHRRISPLLRQFLQRRLIPENSITRFEAAVASAFRLRNSVLAEVLLIAAVYGIGIMIVWRHYLALDAATWYATPSEEGSKLTLGGMWYGYVSLPIVQFLLLALVLAIVRLGASSMASVAHRVEPGSRASGSRRRLGISYQHGYGFAMLAAAHGALTAGEIASRIFFAGAMLSAFGGEICMVVIFVLCLVLGPLLMFAPQLATAKQAGLLKYGTLGERYVREFDAKWLEGGAPADEALVGSADIQSLADLSNSYEVVRSMRFAPITNHAVFRLVAVTLVPIAPLLLAMIPLNELLEKLLGLAF